MSRHIHFTMVEACSRACVATIRRAAPALFRVDAHLDRFHASARTYRIEIPYTAEQLTEAICEVIRRNEFEIC